MVLGRPDVPARTRLASCWRPSYRLGEFSDIHPLASDRIKTVSLCEIGAVVQTYEKRGRRVEPDAFPESAHLKIAVEAHLLENEQKDLDGR